MSTAARTRAQELITRPYPIFQNVEALPWSPWVMPGVSYKLLSVDNRTGGFTCLLKVDPATVAPVHQHLGAIELLVLSGDIYYDPAAKGVAGDYMYEPAGDVHAPSSDGGCVLFCVFEGPIAGLDDDGNVALIVTNRLMGSMAAEHGVASGVHGLDAPVSATVVPDRFAGKVGLVTGGVGGFGAEIATRFAAEGGTIAVLDLESAKDRGDDLVARITASGGRALFQGVDVTDPASVDAAVTSVVDATGRLDVAFNNAGVGGAMAPLAEYPVDAWRQVLDVNLSGVFHCMRAELPFLVQADGGAVVNTASVLGALSMATISAYVASKHAVVGLTRTAALEYGPAGVRVNAVGPSFTRVGYTAEALADDTTWSDLAARHALGRTGRPADVAALALFLASADAGFVTGQLVVVDGGYSIH